LSIIAAITSQKPGGKIRIEVERVERNLVQMPANLVGRVAAGNGTLPVTA